MAGGWRGALLALAGLPGLAQGMSVALGNRMTEPVRVLLAWQGQDPAEVDLEVEPAGNVLFPDFGRPEGACRFQLLDGEGAPAFGTVFAAGQEPFTWLRCATQARTRSGGWVVVWLRMGARPGRLDIRVDEEPVIGGGSSPPPRQD